MCADSVGQLSLPLLRLLFSSQGGRLHWRSATGVELGYICLLNAGVL